MRKILFLAMVVSLTACSGIRATNNSFTTHAESFRIVGFEIPGDDQARARELVPSGATINSQHSTPADWTSFIGVLGNIFWIHQTTISGTK